MEFDQFFLKSFRQVSTRGVDPVPMEEFKKTAIDFSAVLDHLKIHTEGKIAGSQFNGILFKDPEDVIMKVLHLLPDRLYFDQFNRAEIEMGVIYGPGQLSRIPIGWSLVTSFDKIYKAYPDAVIRERPWMPGGKEYWLGEGSWYPEMVQDSATGKFVVALDEKGEVKNPFGKFEPYANICEVPEALAKDIGATRLVSVVIQKDERGLPLALTVVPGEIAPPYPAKIDTEGDKSDTLGPNTPESRFWKNHVFLRIKE